MPRFTKHLWMIVLALTALVVLFAPASQAASPRLVVQMDEPFEINGELIPPSKLLHSIALQGESPHELLPATQQPSDTQAASLQGNKDPIMRAPR